MERPIILNAESVRAIFADKKTQLRRVLNPQPTFENNMWHYGDYTGWSKGVSDVPVFPGHSMYKRAPFKVDDILWVKETWASIAGLEPDNLFYKATATDEDLQWFGDKGWGWRSHMTMPKPFSRLSVRVTSLHVERLVSLTPQGARDEGFDGIAFFIEDWDRRRKKRGLKWEDNPWVWVFDFERINPKGVVESAMPF